MTLTRGGNVAGDPIWDAKGDLAVATAADVAAKLSVGANGQVLTADSAQTTGTKWATPASAGSVATDAIWDTKGDLAAATGADAASKLAVGSNGQRLEADSTQSTGLKWVTPTTVATDTVWDTKGDIAAATGADAASKLAAGANGSALIADSSQSTGLRWTQLSRVLRVVLDGGGVALTTGAKKVYLSVPIDCTITKARVLADQSGSIVLDVWKDTYANFAPTVADTITASAKPTLSSAQKSEDSTLTGWTTSLTAGDVIEVNIDSVSTVTKVFLDLFVNPR